ncbi:hypothetical protein GCM10010464_78170 [Pseudonocardia yunnanensis]
MLDTTLPSVSFRTGRPKSATSAGGSRRERASAHTSIWNDPEDRFAALNAGAQRDCRPQRGGCSKNDEEDRMTDTTRRFTAGLREALRRLDAWTLIAFNPRYPTPGGRG